MDFKKVYWHETKEFPLTLNNRSANIIYAESTLDLKLKLMSFDLDPSNEIFFACPANYLYFYKNSPIIDLFLFENPSMFEYEDRSMIDLFKNTSFGWVEPDGTIYTVKSSYKKIYQHKDIDPNTGYFHGKPINSLKESKLHGHIWVSFSESRQGFKYKRVAKKIGNRQRRLNSKNIIKEQLKESI